MTSDNGNAIGIGGGGNGAVIPSYSPDNHPTHSSVESEYNDVFDWFNLPRLPSAFATNVAVATATNTFGFLDDVSSVNTNTNGEHASISSSHSGDSNTRTAAVGGGAGNGGHFFHDVNGTNNSGSVVNWDTMFSSDHNGNIQNGVNSAAGGGEIGFGMGTSSLQSAAPVQSNEFNITNFLVDVNSDWFYSGSL